MYIRILGAGKTRITNEQLISTENRNLPNLFQLVRMLRKQDEEACLHNTNATVANIAMFSGI